jgi:hypothetical protein
MLIRIAPQYQERGLKKGDVQELIAQSRDERGRQCSG